MAAQGSYEQNVGKAVGKLKIEPLLIGKKTAYLMRLHGLSLLKIARRMGVSASVVRRHFPAAQRRLWEWETHHREPAQNDLPKVMPFGDEPSPDSKV